MRYQVHAKALALGAILTAAWLVGSYWTGPPPLGARADTTGQASKTLLETTGKTCPAPGRSATIAPVVLHDVTEVLVKPGDRVKKDQVLVKLDDDEPRADLRSREAALAELKAGLARLKAQPREEEREETRAALESATVSVRENTELLERMEPGFRGGSIPEQRYHETKAALHRSKADERAAKARLTRLLKQPIEMEIAEAEARVANAQAAMESAKAELEHYTLQAALDGVITWLEVNPGTVSRPGTTVWGEILDLREIDVHCDLAASQADRLRTGQAAEVAPEGTADFGWKGQVVLIGLAADRRTGLVPVRVRIPEANEKLRCYIPVRVRFLDR